VRRAGSLLLAALLLAGPAAGQGPTLPASDEPPSFTFRTSLKTSLLASRAPDAPELFPTRASRVLFLRARFEPTLRFGERVVVTGAYEQRVQAFTHAPGLSGAGILPVDTPAPFRIWQLDWSLVDRSGVSWRHEIDRAAVAWHLPKANLTIGRQAIGWGRAVMFTAADVFAPFTPLQADREWRRGVDAVRLETPLSDRVSVEGVVTGGDFWQQSVVAGRLRGYGNRLDAELVGGRRARDDFGGLTSSAAVGDAEIHGEVVVFRARDPNGTGGEIQRTVVKTVVGGSYQCPVGSGLLIFAEYHYSGFGVPRPEDVLEHLLDPAFLLRVTRGDTQILGRHAVGVTAATELTPTLAIGVQWLHSPADHSGVIAPTSTVTFSDTTSLVVNAYVPYGSPPEGTTLRSQFGATGLSGFVQLNVYL
jgi:hypothetical protein